MYVYKPGRGYCKLRADIHKSIKFDSYTYEAINNYRGKNFSERLRNLVSDFMEIKDNGNGIPARK